MSNKTNSDEKLKQDKGADHSKNFLAGMPVAPTAMDAQLPTVLETDLSEKLIDTPEYRKKKRRAERRLKSGQKNNTRSPNDLLKEAQSAMGAAGNVAGMASGLAASAADAAGSLAGSAMGTAGAAAGAIAGVPNLIEGSIQMAADLVSQTITDIVSFTMETLTTKLLSVVTPPTIGEIMGKSADYMKQYVEENGGEEVANLLCKAEQIQELKQKLSIMEVLENTVSAINEKISMIKKTIEKYLKVIGNCIKKMKEYVAFGQEWMQQQVDNIANDIKDSIEDFICDQTEELLKIKERCIDGLAKSIGTGLGKAIVAVLKKNAKDIEDALREKKNNVVISAKAKAGKALLNLLARIGF